MFVTQNERLPLGGVLTFLIPMTLIGALAGYFLPANITIYECGERCSLISSEIELNDFLFLICIPLLFVWRGGRPFSSMLASVLLAAFFVLAIGSGFSLWVQFSIVVALAFAVTIVGRPDFVESMAGIFSYSYLFPSLINVQIIAFCFQIAVGLLAILTVSLFLMVDRSSAPELIGVSNYLTVWGRELNGLWSAIVGGIAGVLMAFLRAQRALVGALRYALLLGARYLFPVVVLIAWVFILATFNNPKYTQSNIVDIWLFLATLLLVAVALVYVDGSQGAPKLWLRMSMWFAAITVPVLLLPSLTVFTDLASSSGIGNQFQILILCFASVALLFNVVLDLTIRTQRWMPLMAWSNMIVVGMLFLAPIAINLST